MRRTFRRVGDLGRPFITGVRIALLALACIAVVLFAVLLLLHGATPRAASLLGLSLAIALASVLAVVVVEGGFVRRRLDELHVARGQVAGLHVRTSAMEQLLADELRRPWEPVLRPWAQVQLPDPPPVLLLPGADYHLPELIELGHALRRRGQPALLACGRPHWDRTAEGFTWYPDEVVFEAPGPDQVRDFGAIVAMKDWAGYQPLIQAANEADVPTLAKVEGVQDYHDVDTPKPRRPYRTARVILCQGRNDADNLPGDTRVVGSTRLERLWLAPPARSNSPLAVINLNFTYGVLTRARSRFLSTAVEACERARIPYVVSLHPAERARTLHPAAVSIGVSRLLNRATVLISRFSTAGFEAMARGVPFVYHNPHGEEVGTFHDPAGAFEVTSSVDELAKTLMALPGDGDVVRRRAAPFFLRQVDVVAESPSEERCADVVARLIASA